MPAGNQDTIQREIDCPDDLLDLHRLNPERYPCLLESIAGNTPLSRFDILFGFPQSELRLDAGGQLSGHGVKPAAGFLDTLDAWFGEDKIEYADNAQLPFRGGWFLLLGYELAEQIEPSLKLQQHPTQPVALALRIPLAVVRDRLSQRAWIVAESNAEQCIDEVIDDLGSCSGTAQVFDRPVLEAALTEDEPRRFIDAVNHAKKHIAAGDIFQVNLSREWHGQLRAGIDPGDLYERLRRSNPAPFAALARIGQHAVISSSPERWLHIADGIAQTRPIAGTRPRDTNAELAEDFLNDPKERAEHIMVIDLERNDLGRVCAAGSVEVDEFMTLETYSHVHHIVSNIKGRLETAVTPGQLIAAMFPGGSISGCPKVRSMEVIADLEQRARGFYTGSMGYLNRNGSGDFNILIRAMTTHNREVAFATGCGIVADSDPELELAETRAKAKGLILALAQTDDDA